MKELLKTYSIRAHEVSRACDTYQSINPWILRAIFRVESALKPDAISRNSNGTSDVRVRRIPFLQKSETVESILATCGFFGIYIPV